PDRVELAVQEMARRDRETTHASVVGHDAIPPERRDHVRLLVEQALLELAHQSASLVDVTRAGLAIVQGVERAVGVAPVARVGAIAGEELVKAEVGLDDVAALPVHADLHAAGADRVEPGASLQYPHAGA